jgi:uncharacterized protein (TIGR04255 family)
MGTLLQDTLDQGRATVPDQVENPEPKWLPVNGSHAIQMAYASVIFAQPVTAVIWNKVLVAARAAAAAADLNIENPIHSMMLQIGPAAGPNPAPIQNANAGFQFQRHQGSNLVGEQFVVQPNQIRFETYTYTRWAGFKSTIQSLFEAVLPEYFSAVNVGQVALEYTDVFHWSVDGDADSSQIVDVHSPVIATSVMQPEGQWHCHSGWFDDQRPGGRRLSNADITVADALVQNEPRRAINIRTFEASQFMFGQDGQPIDGPPSPNDIFDLFDSHHLSLKNLLNKILTPRAQNMISLGASNA